MKQHFQQIDILKCLAIMAVISLHSLSRTQLVNSYAIYHIWQAVPIFMVLMGLNLGLSLQKKTKPQFKELYTKVYFSKKATRILLPFVIIFLASLVLGIVWSRMYGRNVFTFNAFTFIGLLPITGKGNYFITLLLQSILVLPLVGYLFKKAPVLCTLGLISFEVAFLLCSKYFSWFQGDADYLYSAAIFRYFSALGLGLWLSKLMHEKYNLWGALAIAILGCFSMVYLYFTVYTSFTVPAIYSSWQTQNVASFGYAALVILIFLLALPANSGKIAFVYLAKIGHSSYHIFLVQVVYFGLAVKQDNLLLNLIVCIAIGYLFYLVESAISKKLISINSHKSKV